MIPLLWFVYYAFVKTVGRFIPWVGKRLSRDVHRRATTKVAHGIEFDGLSLSIPEGSQPAGVRIACAFHNRSRAAAEIVGADLRVGRIPTGGTIHRLCWEGKPPLDVSVAHLDRGAVGGLSFTLDLPPDLYGAPEAELWVDGTIRLRSEQPIGGRRVGIGEHGYGFSHEAVEIEEALAGHDRERFEAARETIARRLG